MAMAAQLSENSHQGFEGIKAGLCLASMESKSNDASGMPVCLWQNGIRSRSSGKERDAETGLDYFGARYLSAAQGRFTSPDSPSFASLQYPQSWNLYAYVLNNPLKFNDPSGHAAECKKGDVDQCLSDLRGAVANTEAANRIYPNKIGTRTFIGIRGDLASFRKLGQNASRLVDIVDDKRIFGYNVSTSWKGAAIHYITAIIWQPRWMQLRGGGQTCTPSMGYEPEVFVDPNPATKIDQDSIDQNIPTVNQGEKAAHEFLGHLWGEIFGGHDVANADKKMPKANKQDALDAENAVRKTDPKRGQKTHHHNE
jgi:RHS repeat-associated protein